MPDSKLEAVRVGDCYTVDVPLDTKLPLITIPYVFGFLININCEIIDVAALLASHYRGLFRVVVVNGTIVSTTEFDYPLGLTVEQVDRNYENEQIPR